MKSADVCTRWASQSHAQTTANNARHRGEKLFHYGALIGLITLDAFGRPCALISSGHFSSGTSKVQGEAAEACRRAGLVFHRVRWVDPAETDANLTEMMDEIAATLARIENARIPDGHRTRAQTQVVAANAYAAAFGSPRRYAGPDIYTVRSRHEREEQAQ